MKFSKQICDQRTGYERYVYTIEHTIRFWAESERFITSKEQESSGNKSLVWLVGVHNTRDYVCSNLHILHGAPTSAPNSNRPAKNTSQQASCACQRSTLNSMRCSSVSSLSEFISTAFCLNGSRQTIKNWATAQVC